jgi:two-component system response regulator AtoC
VRWRRGGRTVTLVSVTKANVTRATSTASSTIAHRLLDATQVELIVSTPTRRFTRRLPQSGALTFGRGIECDVPVDDPSVSRQHIRIHVGNPPLVEDLGSRNGTQIDGHPLAPGAKTVLLLGSVVRFGDTSVHVLRWVPEREQSSERPGETDDGIVVEDPAVRELFGLARKVASTDLSVLLLGETGVGKDVFARAVHAHSPRRARPLVAVNCAALPEAILESELFGYERGAFTGAVQSKAGLLESAHGGTLFLDEIGEMPVTMQAKLLRVLADAQLTRLGSTRARVVDLRTVSATNRDLEVAVAEGQFRLDLFYRLKGIAIRIPPLRERISEIMKLAALFAERACARAGRPTPGFSEDAVQALREHPWPGNIRELRNVVECAIAVGDGETLTAEALLISPRPRPATPDMAAPAVTHEVRRGRLTRAEVVDALQRAAGNQSLAAELLGVSRRTLIKRLEDYQLPRPKKGQRDPE